MALLSPLLLIGTLPRMHERYFFLADILAFARAMTMRTRASWSIAALVQAGSTMAGLGYLYDTQALSMAGAVAMVVATYRVATVVNRSVHNRSAEIHSSIGGEPITHSIATAGETLGATV